VIFGWSAGKCASGIKQINDFSLLHVRVGKHTDILLELIHVLPLDLVSHKGILRLEIMQVVVVNLVDGTNANFGLFDIIRIFSNTFRIAG